MQVALAGLCPSGVYGSRLLASLERLTYRFVTANLLRGLLSVDGAVNPDCTAQALAS